MRSGRAASAPPESAAAVWQALAAKPAAEPDRFDDATLAELPDPAKRWLTRVLPNGCLLHEQVVVTMTGDIRIGRWRPFTADQILRQGTGFVWRPIVGGRLVRFVGSDVLGPQGASMTFRLHGLIPVVNESGDAIKRSALGRLAIETVAWLPQATTPQAGGQWTAIDNERARVTIDAAGEPTTVEITVADDGRLIALELKRWHTDHDQLEPFGGDILAEHLTDDGVRIAGQAEIGWGYRTERWADEMFFRFTLRDASFDH